MPTANLAGASRHQPTEREHREKCQLGKRVDQSAIQMGNAKITLGSV